MLHRNMTSVFQDCQTRRDVAARRPRPLAVPAGALLSDITHKEHHGFA